MVGNFRLFIAIDRTSKFACVRFVERAGKMEAAGFLRELVQACLAASIQFRPTAASSSPRKHDIREMQHIVDRVCDEHEHRLTRANHPCTTTRGSMGRLNA